ncbi:thiolase family protein [Selenomonadales bacterium OttesenSCG-928-I06]|nr:thiolase family protein [Selenomonadales bacterium OttesenSCG-928-I06]
MLKEAYIIDGARSPFAVYGGSLKDVHPTDLGAFVLKEAIRKAGVAPENVTGTIIGNALAYDTQACMVHRHVARKAGLPIETSGMHVNTLCGTGYQCVATAAYQIQLGLHEIMGVVGTECMDRLPYYIDSKKLRPWGAGAGNIEIIDQLFNPKINVFMDETTGLTMPLTAENVIEKYGITREECDEYTLRSHLLAQKATESGRFAQEIVPIEVKDRKETRMFTTDENIRKDISMEKLAKLKPVFRADGKVTAGNASGINSGAAAIILASGEAVKKYGLKPLAKFVGNKLIGCEPTLMGLGPVPAMNGLLEEKGLKLSDMDLIEINEAFAGQVLGCVKEMGIDMDKFNVNGSGIAIGHPIAATGVRIVLSLAYEMKNRDSKYGMASICIGGGQGSAILFERP